MTTQPEALRLANLIAGNWSAELGEQAAATLRRLHEINTAEEALVEELFSRIDALEKIIERNQYREAYPDNFVDVAALQERITALEQLIDEYAAQVLLLERALKGALEALEESRPIDPRDKNAHFRSVLAIADAKLTLGDAA